MEAIRRVVILVESLVAGPPVIAVDLFIINRDACGL